MDDPLLVGVLHTIADLHEESQPILSAQALSVAVLRQRHPFDILHGKKWPAIIARACLVGSGDVRVVHERQGLALGLEASQHLLGVHPPPDELKGHTAPYGGLLFGLPYLAHAALAELLQEPEVADPIGWTSLLHRVRRRLVELQEGFHLVTEFVVARALLIEKRRTPVDR